MNATSGPRAAAHQARETAAGPAAGAAREPAAGLLPRGGGTILDAIGDTPLVMVDGIWVKLEYLNPSGSIKARIATYMIERAEREGLLAPGDTIVEASSGNTGNAMSMVAAVKGYRMLVVMPDGMSGERLAISRAFGAQVMTLGDFHVNDARWPRSGNSAASRDTSRRSNPIRIEARSSRLVMIWNRSSAPRGSICP
jgi:threonine synthase